MKLEKRQKFIASNLKWGILPLLANKEENLMNYPALVASEFCEPVFISNRVTNSLKLYHQNLTSNIELQGYKDESISVIDEYSLVRQSSFIDFFTQSAVDVPKCFKKSRSSRRFIFELFFARLTNYFMKKGNKEKMFTLVNQTFNVFFQTYKKNLSYTSNLYFKNWLSLYFAFSNISITSSKYFNFFFKSYENTLNQQFIKDGYKFSFGFGNLLTIISKLFFVVQPLFHFSSYNLDKKARKTGRKKKSKYIFIWKYIPIYKRKSLLLKLLAADVKFNSGKNFPIRFLESINTLLKNPADSHVVKTNKFAHAYVFKNLRKSLLTNFKMIA